MVEILLGCDLGDLSGSFGFLSLVLCSSLSTKLLSFLSLFIFISPHEIYFTESIKIVEQTIES